MGVDDNMESDESDEYLTEDDEYVTEDDDVAID